MALFDCSTLDRISQRQSLGYALSDTKSRTRDRIVFTSTIASINCDWAQMRLNDGGDYIGLTNVCDRLCRKSTQL